MLFLFVSSFCQSLGLKLDSLIEDVSHYLQRVEPSSLLSISRSKVRIFNQSILFAQVRVCRYIGDSAFSLSQLVPSLTLENPKYLFTVDAYVRTSTHQVSVLPGMVLTHNSPNGSDTGAASGLPTVVGYNGSSINFDS